MSVSMIWVPDELGIRSAPRASMMARTVAWSQSAMPSFRPLTSDGRQGRCA